MPIPGKFIAFVHSPRLDPIAKALGEAHPSLWGTTLLPATARIEGRRGPQRAGADKDAIRKALTAKRATVTGAILFVVDVRHDEFKALENEFAFDFPVVELVTTHVAGSVVEALRPHLEYFGIVPSSRPAHVREALDMFRTRHPDVQVLPKALTSADASADFNEPRLVLGSLHALYRYSVVWQVTKQKDHQRSRAQFVLKQNRREALAAMMNHVSFDVSDAAMQAKDSRTWLCPDQKKRYFGRHLKWSLAGPRNVAFHCRIHYHVEEPKGAPPVLWIGHCGEHLD